jgi:hypothetical protein
VLFMAGNLWLGECNQYNLCARFSLKLRKWQRLRLISFFGWCGVFFLNFSVENLNEMASFFGLEMVSCNGL